MPRSPAWPRLHKLVAILTFLVGAYLIVWCLQWIEHNSNEENFYKIQPGMTLGEVTQILGQAPSPPAVEPVIDPNGDEVITWEFGNGSVHVWFNPKGRATMKSWEWGEKNNGKTLKEIIKDFLSKLGF